MMLNLYYPYVILKIKETLAGPICPSCSLLFSYTIVVFCIKFLLEANHDPLQASSPGVTQLILASQSGRRSQLSH